MTKFQAPRGTHDVLPAEFPLWNHVIRTAEDVCALYGYRPIQTPTFEDTELFLRTSGAGSDIVRKEMYTFQDLGGRSLTLRPEATAPICRAYIEHGLHREPQPVKLFTVASFYRYDAPQKGRYREHHQLSVEALGSDDPALDAEVIQLYTELLRRLGIGEYTILLNSIGDRECRPAYIERLRAWLAEHDAELDEDTREKAPVSPLRVFDTKNPAVARALEGAPTIGESLCDACAAHFARVRAYLEAYGVPVVLVPTLVRGLDYYTRTTFEFASAALGSQDALVGGGRYDYLVEQIGGPPTPALGFGAGIERLLMAIQDTGAMAEDPGVDVFFVCHDERERFEVVPLLAELRRNGLRAELDYARRSERGQVTQANRLRARWIVIVTGVNGVVRERDGRTDWDISLLDRPHFVERLKA